MITGASYAKMLHGNTHPSEWQRIYDKMNNFADLGAGYVITPPYDKRTVDDFVLETQRLSANSVIIDQLQYVQWKGHHDIEHQGFREIVHEMKASAIKLQVPWYCVGQFNREAASLEELADASKAGLTRAIEETCDMFLGLHRTKEDMDENRVELGIVESRHSSKYQWMIDVDLNNTTSFAMRSE
jgi:replicative DNA helicase